MSRLHAIETHAASGKAKELLEAVQAKLKVTPNMTKVMANSSAVLDAYVSFSGALAEGSLSGKLREMIALEIAEQNGCQYCVSAHTAISKLGGLTSGEIEDAREGRANSPKDAAALAFARLILMNRGRTTSADFEGLRKAGFSDGEIAEIVAHVALNVFTNYFNVATDVEVDFPKIELHKAA